MAQRISPVGSEEQRADVASEFKGFRVRMKLSAERWKSRRQEKLRVNSFGSDFQKQVENIVLTPERQADIDRRAKEDMQIMSEMLLQWDERARSDVYYMDSMARRDTRLSALRLMDAAEDLSLSARLAAEEHWVDGGLRKDLSKADTYARRRLLEDTYIATKWLIPSLGTKPRPSAEFQDYQLFERRFLGALVAYLDEPDVESDDSLLPTNPEELEAVIYCLLEVGEVSVAKDLVAKVRRSATNDSPILTTANRIWEFLAEKQKD